VDRRSRQVPNRDTLSGMDNFRPTIRTQAELEKAWRHLMSPLGFSGYSIWMMVIEPNHKPVPHLTQIEDAELPPDANEESGFADFLRAVADDALEPGSRMAFLISRPGRNGAGERDRTWAARLYGACRKARLPCETVHLATDHVLMPLPLDELDASASA
jgi:hypothetical protein